VIAVTTLWVIGLVVALGVLVDRATSAPAARRVSIWARLDEARRIAAASRADVSTGRLPCEQPLDRTVREARRHQPRSYVASCRGGAALGLRHTRGP
jgi:hypothetical protein